MLFLSRHPERSKYRGAVFAESNEQKRAINRAFLRAKRKAFWGLARSLHIQILNELGVLLDEFTARLDLVAHQGREDLVAQNGVLHRDA